MATAQSPVPADARGAGRAGATTRLPASPAARHAARRLGITLSEVRADPPIRLRDVLAHTGGARGTSESARLAGENSAHAIGSSPQPAVPPRPTTRTSRQPTRSPGRAAELPPTRPTSPSTTVTASRIRRLTAEHTMASLRETAQLTQTFEVDMTAIATLRAQAEAIFAEREGVALTFLPFVAKAVVEALGLHPNVNARIDAGHTAITYHERVSLGIAVDTPRGLLTPVVANADDLSLAGLARSITEVAAGARAGTPTADQLSGGTCTITDIGSHGALFDTPILVRGQAAILGFGAIVRRPVVRTDADGRESIAIRSMCYLPLTYDHRLIDGADAGRFLTTVKRRLEAGLFHSDVGLESS